MGSDPAFLFYSDNFLSGTMFMTDEQLGKYIRLLCAQHLTGHLSEKNMLFICKEKDDDIWAKFEKDENGLYFNERLDLEINKRKHFTDSRAKNLCGKSLPQPQVDSHMADHKDALMEDGNENGIESVIKHEDKKSLEYLRSNINLFIFDKEFEKIDVAIEFKKFEDYLKAKGKRYKDYVAAFRNWLRSDFGKKAKELTIPKLKNKCPLDLPASRWKYITPPKTKLCADDNTELEMYISVYEELETDDFYNLRWWCPKCGIQEKVTDEYYPKEHLDKKR